MSDSDQAHVYSLDAYRNRRRTARTKLAAPAAEIQAAELMSTAAALLLDAGPAHLKIAWILQDLRDLLINAQVEGDADFAADKKGAGKSPAQLEMLTNLS